MASYNGFFFAIIFLSVMIRLLHEKKIRLSQCQIRKTGFCNLKGNHAISIK